MRFIQITESATTAEVTCLVKGLIPTEATAMEESLRNAGIKLSRDDTKSVLEADTSGITILNILGVLEYKLLSQSMAIEVSNIGGRTIRVQKIVWTMGK